ncbi:MAG TPA: DUF4403 family protein [Puia sp.]|nr:DUF4403 family protein [Puia sp.]
MKYLKASLFSLIVLIFVSCSSTKKTSSSISSAANTFHLPDSLPALPSSEFDLPLKIYAPPVLAKADSIVPKEFDSDGWPNFSQPSCDFRYKYHFVRSGLNVACTNNKIVVQFTGNYQLSGSKCICAMNKPVSPWISGSCGYGDEPLRRIAVSVSSQLNFLSSYKIKSFTRIDNLLAYDKCMVSLFSSDVTGLVVDSVRSSVTAFCSALDQAIAGMDFSKTFQQAFAQAYIKTPISKYGYLSVNPSIIRIGQLNYSNDTFNISVGVTCRPQLSSDSTNAKYVSVLPALHASENKNAVSLYLSADYDYAFLSKLLDDTLRNKVFDTKGKTFVIKQAAIKGIGNHQIEVRIDFAGSNRGRIYLRGTPVLDAPNQALTMPDITYALQDEDIALKIGKKLFRNKIKKNLQGKSYLDVAALIKSNLHILNAKLNNTKLSNGIYSSGVFNDIRIIGLLARDNTIQMQLYTNASIAIISTGKP